MKVLLIMQLVFVGAQKGGPAIETVILDSIEQCQKAKSVFIYDMKETRPRRFGSVYKKAACVPLKDK